MNYQLGKLLYEGKAKKLFAVDGHPELVIQEFKDSMTAFNALKKEEFSSKGHINREISSKVFQYLERQGVPTHRVVDQGERSMVVRRLEMLKLEVVVRNVLAGSTAKKFAIAEGTVLDVPLIEFYLKEDALQDPFMSEAQALMLKVVQSPAEIAAIESLALRVNQALCELFLKAGLQLVDFKIEVGRDTKGEILLADEISPDCCRLWDVETGEKYDKDRFRRDLGGVMDGYREVLNRLERVLHKIS